MRFDIKNKFHGDEDTKSIFAQLLHSRGLKTSKEMEDFLRPGKPDLKMLLSTISIDLKQLAKTKKILTKAIKDGLDICVFGDYDADGITSTTIMWQTLSRMAKGSKARVMPFIPDRARHGYGLSVKAVEDIMTGGAFQESAHPDFRPQLIITVDNGIVAHNSVGDLKKRGLSVIITDHHEPAKNNPDADTIIHSTDTSGAGIAWVTCLYLTGEAEYVKDLIDVATIGIVADQIPLVGINRNIVFYGLRALNNTHNLGLQTLVRGAGIENRSLTTYDINFVIAPRINAVGRLDNPVDALRLLCSPDQAQIDTIAAQVEQHNLNRQSLTESAIASASLIKVEHNIVVAASPDYHEGIIGLVAGKLTEMHHRPAIVISIGEKVSKGSARSVGDIDVTSIMREFEHMLVGVGGHKLAGGLSIETNRISEFTDALYTYADLHIQAKSLESKSVVDGELTLAQSTKTLAILLSSLEPYGMGNPKPRFLVRGVRVLEDRKIGKDGRHRKLVVEQGGVTRDVIWFNGAAHHPLSKIQCMVFYLDINEWRDRQTVQLNAQYVEI